MQSLARLLEAYDTSLTRNRLSETMCRRYIDTLNSCGETEKALTVSSRATDTHPRSVELWQVRLELLSAASVQSVSGKTRKSKAMKKKGEERVCEECRNALDKVPAKVGNV